MKRALTTRVFRLAIRCKTQAQVQRLWDWIDCQAEPEPLWQALGVGLRSSVYRLRMPV